MERDYRINNSVTHTAKTNFNQIAMFSFANHETSGVMKLF